MILHICLSRSWGGLEMFTLETSRLLQERQASQLFVGLEGSSLIDAHRAENLPCIAVHPNRLRALFTIRGLIKKYPEAVVACERLRDLTLLRLALLGAKNPLVGYAHSFIGVSKNDLLHCWTHRRLDLLVTFTERQKQNFLEMTPTAPEKTIVFPHGVDLERFHPPEKPAGTDGEIIVGVVGRLDPQKGQRDLIRAVGQLKDPRVRLWIVGDETAAEPGERHTLEEMIKAEGLTKQTRFIPFQAEIEKVLQRMHISVMPSHQETFGRVLIESMACGLACVATDAGGVPDIIEDGVSGLLVEPQSADSIAGALKKLIQDRELRQKIGHRARRRAEAEFSQQLFLDRLFASIHGQELSS